MAFGVRIGETIANDRMIFGGIIGSVNDTYYTKKILDAPSRFLLMDMGFWITFNDKNPIKNVHGDPLLGMSLNRELTVDQDNILTEKM